MGHNTYIQDIVIDMRTQIPVVEHDVSIIMHVESMHLIW